MAERLTTAEVDVCPTCGWAKGSDGGVAICPYHDKRCVRVEVQIPPESRDG